jgi:hypothetical protein
MPLVPAWRMRSDSAAALVLRDDTCNPGTIPKLISYNYLVS